MRRPSQRDPFAVVVSLLMLVLVLYACGSDTGTNPEDSEPEVAGQVDASGATLSAQSGNVSLTVPPGAVPATTTITVQAVADEPADPNLVPGTLFEFGPDGLQFEEPVTLRLAYDPTAIPEQVDEAQLRIFKRSGTGWLPTDNGSVDVATATVSGEIDSFSQYAVVSFGTLAVATTSLLAGVEQVQYDIEQLTATGGDSVYFWTVASGALPAGLSLLPDGSIFGTPSVVGTETATFEVESGDGQTAQKELSITVGPRPILLATELCTDYPGYAIATFADINLEVAAKASVGLGPADPLSCLDASGVQFVGADTLGILSLVGVQNLPNLVVLSLSDNPLIDITPLGSSSFSRLTSLTLSRDSLTDISALNGLTSLTQLGLFDNSITDASPIAGLTALTVLNLSSNLINDVGPLSELTSLTHLYLNDNLLVNVLALGGLTSLLEITLDHNRLGDISGLSGNTNLYGLSLEGNTTMDGFWFFPLLPYRSPIGDLQGLTNLQYVNLTDTPIGTFEPVLAFQPLLNNVGLGAGDAVHLRGARMDCSIPVSLRAKGVSVSMGNDCTG